MLLERLVRNHPLPDGKAKVGEMWALMAKRYVHLKKQFIIKATLALMMKIGRAHV